MHYFCVSFTHKNTDIALREKLSFAHEDKKREVLKFINANDNIFESLVISTCNRVEIFAFVNDMSKSADYIISCIAVLCGVDKELLAQKADLFEDSGAIHHLFSVASSLDSLVIGETQIAGQLKEAFYFAMQNEFCHLHLSRAVHYAFKCAAKVRNQTEISKNPISVASVAVAKAKELVELRDKEVVIIGAGQMSELAAKHLIQAGAKLIILNRSIQKAKELCENLGVRAGFDDFSSLKSYLHSHEVFFSATSTSHAIISDDMLEEKEESRYFFDLAVPRDIDLKESAKIKVFAVDDLEEVVRKNLALREHQAQIAYSIIAAMTTQFYKHLNDLALMPIIKALRLQAKAVAELSLEKALKKGYLKNSDKEEARKLIHQVFKSFLHNPTMKLKHLQGKIQSDNIITAMRYVFDLKNDLDELNHYKCDYTLENTDEIE